MLVRVSSYKASISRNHGSSRGSSAFAIIGIGAAYVAIGACFYWLMQPTVVKNGLAGYTPPPATVISAAAALPPPGPAVPLVALAPPAPEIAEAPAVPKKEQTKREAREAREARAEARDAREVRQAPRRERPAVVAQPRQGWDNHQSW